MMDRVGWRLGQKRGRQGWEEEEPLQADRSSRRLGAAGTTLGTADLTQWRKVAQTP